MVVGAGENGNEFDSEGLVLLSSLVTSNIRALKFCGSKIKSTEILSSLACYMNSDEIVLDRMLPYVIVQLTDHFPRVRIAAFRSLIKCLKAVKKIPTSDTNIFPEYILPNLLPLSHDRNELVRVAFATGIAEIAQESVRFLDLIMLCSHQKEPFEKTDLGNVTDQQVFHKSDMEQASAHNHNSGQKSETNYDKELVALHEFIGILKSIPK